jgi:Zn finger protein HypA/HybF involved in hydrogenase expression
MDCGKASMHDFLLAKEIVDEVLNISKEKKVENIKSVDLEIGTIALAHDGFSEHVEDASLENLQFGLESISKDTKLSGVKFNIKKVEGNTWSIVNVEVL